MWPVDGGSDVVYVHLKAYFLDLVQEIASATGDPAVGADWSKKVQELRRALENS
jgi:hypothetical protein